MAQDVALSDLQTVAVLGEGAFGLVKLVRLKSSPTTTWAFKCMQKQRIVATKQQANVMREKTLLAQARHPFLPVNRNALRRSFSFLRALNALYTAHIFC